MIRKYKIYIIMGITVLLLFMVLPVDTKGDWEIPWDITLEGEGNDPAFRSSTVMEIFLKNGTAPKDVTIFVNQQKINPIWDYEQSTQISFQEEGIYKVHIVHKNGCFSTEWSERGLSVLAAGRRYVSYIKSHDRSDVKRIFDR